MIVAGTREPIIITCLGSVGDWSALRLSPGKNLARGTSHRYIRQIGNDRIISALLYLKGK
jgi:hypothetical protein